MTEITQNGLKLLAENQNLKLQLQETKESIKSTTKYLIGIGTALYLSLTVMTIAVIDVNEQKKVISNQSNTIFELTDRVLEQQIILSEVEELLRIRKDLSKVLP